MTLRTRLLAGMALVAFVLTVVATVITVTTRNQLMSQVDRRLEGFQPDVAGQRDGPADGLPGVPRLAPQRASDVYEGYATSNGLLLTRYVPSGRREFGVPVVPATLVEVALKHRESRFLLTTTSDDGDHSYRVLAAARGDLVIITAVPLDDVQHTIVRLIWVEVAGALVILATLGVVVWWVIRLGIRPVREMTATAARIGAGDLSVRIPEPRSAATTESGELAIALNRMLSQIGTALDDRAASQDRLRQFVADASHELRTPLTTIRGYAELYRHGGLSAPEALGDAMRRTEQESARMGRLVEDMLMLARLDAEPALRRLPVDVAAVARDTAADARASAPTRDVTCETPTVAIVHGDEDRIRQVLANVVANALVHTPAESPLAISVAADRDDDAVTVSIVDRGPGMPAEVAERATERFYRADPARSRHRGGSGLGLSIVAAVMQAHGGTVTITPTSGGGTTVELRFPARITDADTDADTGR